MKKKIMLGILILLIILGLWQFPNIYKTLMLEQKHFIKEMKLLIRERERGVFGTLLGMTFLYGLLHSLGPGHGKSFLVTYVLKTKRPEERRVGKECRSRRSTYH